MSNNLPIFKDLDYYTEWRSQLAEAGFNQIDSIVYLAKMIADQARPVEGDHTTRTVPSHHISRLQAMFSMGTTE